MPVMFNGYIVGVPCVRVTDRIRVSLAVLDFQSEIVSSSEYSSCENDD